MKKILTTAAILIMIVIWGCKKENNEPADMGWSDHLMVVNEGPFQTGSGSITAYNRATAEVTEDLFQTVNGFPLGNIVQSMASHKGKFYIVVNNANRVEVVDQVTFKEEGVFTDVSFPAFFLGYNDDKGYLSCWDGTVKVLDLGDYSVSSSIVVGSGPERMVLAADLWVINTGGFGTDSTISVIDTDADTLKRTIETGDVPSGIVMDQQGRIWVLCSGKGWNGFPAAGDTPGRLICYNADNGSIIKEMIFSSSDNHPDNLVYDAQRDMLYYNHPEGVFAVATSASELPAEPLVRRNTMLYGIGFDPASDAILGTDPLDYVQKGWAYFYDPVSGMVQDSIRAGVIPSGFWVGN